MSNTKTTNAVATANNQIQKEASYKSALVKQTETYTNMVISEMQSLNLSLDTYQKVCLTSAIAAINELLYKEGLSFNDKRINQSNLTTLLNQIAMMKLNASATPRECYFSLRNDNSTPERKAAGMKIIEYGIEGNGNDALLRTYGAGVKDVLPCIVIREGDDFQYPHFDGEKMQPFTWKPNSFYKKPIAVVYIIKKEDGSTEYLVSEREQVASNLKAHINQNLMTCYDMTLKNRILAKIENMTLDELLADAELTKPIEAGKDYQNKPKFINLISPAWKSAHAREAMIERKMRNNAIKKYPKDYTKAFADAAVMEKAISDSIDFVEVIDASPIQEINKVEALQEAPKQAPQVNVDEINGEVIEQQQNQVVEQQPQQEANWDSDYDV